MVRKETVPAQIPIFHRKWQWKLQAQPLLSTILKAFLIPSVVLCAIVGFTVGGIIGVRFPLPILSGVLSFPVDCRWALCWMACGVAVGWNRGWTRKLRRQRPLNGPRFGAARSICLPAHRWNYQLEEIVTA
jgi:hypothetical protein